MIPLPVIGRLSLADYRRLFLTWSLLLLDGLVRLLLFFIPFPVSSFLDKYRYKFVGLFPRIFRFDDDTYHPVADLQHTADICHYWGYTLDEYLVETKDGYRLGLHRISSPHLHQDQSTKKPVVLLWHGFMMNSEVWVCHPGGPQHNLAFVLADLGYDVWLGNVRGNKYGCSHLKLKPNQPEFWDFSLDEHALIDLPTTVDYILRMTSTQSLSYIGFSQGTTICFAALSLLPELRSKMNLFVALAPSTQPIGLTNSLISACVRSSLEVLYLIFGRRELLSSVLFYQDVFSPRFLTFMIDKSCSVLFDWKSKNISTANKSVCYQHLYSLCSVKTMMHWFQIIRERRFQMFDHLGSIWRNVHPIPKASPSRRIIPDMNGVHSPMTSPTPLDTSVLQGSPNTAGSPSKTILAYYRPKSRKLVHPATDCVHASPTIGYAPPRFPVDQLCRNEDVAFPSPPIAIFYGGRDTLPDMSAILESLHFPDLDIENRTKDIVDAYTLQQGQPLNGQKATASGRVLYSHKEPSKNGLLKSKESPLVYLKCIPEYEHLCLLWADSLHQEVTPDILSSLADYANPSF